MTRPVASGVVIVALALFASALVLPSAAPKPNALAPDRAEENARQLVGQGRQIFRFDSFGDEAFWSDQLGLHQVVASVSPRQALALGLKVDSDALPSNFVQGIKHGAVDLDDPLVTLELVKQNAVLGVIGSFNPNGTLRSVGLACALCHSTVDDSV